MTLTKWLSINHDVIKGNYHLIRTLNGRLTPSIEVKFLIATPSFIVFEEVGSKGKPIVLREEGIHSLIPVSNGKSN